ncbi:hypothetical protein SHM_04270 [Spiroplasma ixodetis]|uniref:Spiroplasmavirus-related protein n=1 Tax=Spiroplasma ixodetis TaxID=2141 RepID=A0ABM8BSG4_9MOLU|nr:hypothetical protein SHM_04270 [Spiroplasma ixodetis]
MNILKRVIMCISIFLCLTIIWIPFHFMLKTLIYGDKREKKVQTVKS